MCLADGTMLHSLLNIHKAVVEYFQQFLGDSRRIDLTDLSDLIALVISTQDNLSLCKDPLFEEIKDALFTIPIDSSPGPNGLVLASLESLGFY